MQKTAIKAFVYSFSVSLFAIMTANRFLCYDAPSTEPLIINKKNIVLFLKNSTPAKSPVKKIALSTLPKLEISDNSTPQPETEVILASTPEEWEFPLEIAPTPTNYAPEMMAEVLYAPDKPLKQQEIDAEVIYNPEVPKSAMTLAASQTTPKLEAIYSPDKTTISKEQDESATSKAALHQNIVDRPDKKDDTLAIARAEMLGSFPLQQSNKPAIAPGAKIGDPSELNHIAMSTSDVPVESLEKSLNDKADESKTDAHDWQQLSDSPWVVAKSNGGKNQLAKQEFADKSSEEISAALNTSTARPEVKVASETIKNLIIPIPKDIMQDENLTPKLAYPSTSEDAKKEKVIDARIKQQEKLAKAEEKELLLPLEDEIELDPPTNQNAEQSTKPNSDNTAKITAEDGNKKGGIISALSSIFAKSAKQIDEAKERAKAKAKLKRSIKKKIAQNKPISIMPTEIRLSFQPNRAEISGQTLRWVQAFASKAAETPGMTLEIRIDGTSATDLQQKRLNLLHNILTNKGVEYSKINTVFTSREPNSFILRTISRDDRGGTTEKTNNQTTVQHIQW